MVREPWLRNAFLDDQLWHQAMQTSAWINSMRGSDFPEDDLVLWHLLLKGTLDHVDMDSQWDSSTHSMRHSAAIGARLWRLLKKETDRVCAAVMTVLSSMLTLFYRGIVSRGSSRS